MNIKTWIIHKLGGYIESERLPPSQIVVTRPETEEISACLIDKNSILPEEHIHEELIYRLLPDLRDRVKFSKETNYSGETLYRAKIRFVQDYSTEAVKFEIPTKYF